MYGCFVYMYICVSWACLVLLEARRACQSPLDLELQMLVSYCMDGGNQTQDLPKSNKCF